MYVCIEAERETYGVEPICEVLAIAPSGYRAYRAQQQDPTRRCARRFAARGMTITACRVFAKSGTRSGAVATRSPAQGRPPDGPGGAAGRGAGPSRAYDVSRTTVDDTRDLVQRAFVAKCPNQLWVADFTYVATWRGMVYVAFVIDVFSRRIVGWRAHTTMQTALVLDALEQALYDRVLAGAPAPSSCTRTAGRNVSMCYTERRAEAGPAPSVGRVGMPTTTRWPSR